MVMINHCTPPAIRPATPGNREPIIILLTETSFNILKLKNIEGSLLQGCFHGTAVHNFLLVTPAEE